MAEDGEIRVDTSSLNSNAKESNNLENLNNLEKKQHETKDSHSAKGSNIDITGVVTPETTGMKHNFEGSVSSGDKIKSNDENDQELCESVKDQAVQNSEASEKNGREVEGDNDSDEESKVAVQMAAVAVAAAAATSENSSPSVTANYAKDISATIAILPDSQQKKTKEKITVDLDLVRNEIKKIIENSNRKETEKKASQLQNHHAIKTTSDMPDVDETQNGEEVINRNSEVIKTTDSSDKDDSPNIIDSAEKLIEKETLSSVTARKDDSEESSENNKSIYEKKMPVLSDSLIHSYSNNSGDVDTVMIKSIASGKNDSFLKYLLKACSCNLEQLVDKGSKKNLEDQNIGDEESAVIENEEKKAAASRAAGDVISLLRKAESTYDYLISLLPLQHMQLGSFKGSNYDFHAEGCDDSTVIPDLLPPCISINGDATAAFFRICSKVGNNRENRVSPDTNSSNASINNTQQLTGKSGTSDGVRASGTPSLVSSVISSVTGKQTNPANSSNSNTLGGVFGKVRRTRKQSQITHPNSGNKAVNMDNNVNDLAKDFLSSTEEERTAAFGFGYEYTVTIYREMLGLTVENVLERTVVRTVLPGGAAKKAGAKVGSLIVKVGSVETANLTHFETIDELRQSQRPLKLVLRRITKDVLKGAREEMGRLIRGGGFGLSGANSDPPVSSGSSAEFKNSSKAEKKKRPLSDEAYSKVLSMHWTEGTKRKLRAQNLSKKDESLSKAGQKLALILSLLIIGLERMSYYKEIDKEKHISRSASDCSGNCQSHSKSQSSHNDSINYNDAANSLSRILYDYFTNHLDGDHKSTTSEAVVSSSNRKKKHNNASSTVGKQKRNAQNPPANNTRKSSSPTESNLLWIGDALHRSQSFLSDPLSPPAALLRGEVIALLCDILDLDTEMALSEEESSSSTAGEKTVAISDLGSAGSLLKLIVLNCSMMRSPNCVPTTDQLKGGESSTTFDHSNHAGNRFLAVVHRLAASRSTSARVTACSLGPVLWGHLDFARQLQLRGVITRALHDIEIVVRRSTANVLHEIAELVFDPRAVPWLVLMCERAMTDPEPQLRSAAMTLTWHLAEHLPNAFLGDARKGSRSLRKLPPRSDPTFAEVYLLQCKLLPVATRLAEDPAPPVRLAVAAQCDRLSNALGKHWHSVIIDLLQALLGDSDERVRSEAVLCVPRLVESVLMGGGAATRKTSDGVLKSLLPVTIKLQKDSSSSVRISLATASGELLTLLVGLQNLEETSAIDVEGGKNDEELKWHKRHIDETLIPLLQKLLHDSDPEVTSAALRAVTNASRGNVREIISRRKENEQNENDEDSLSLSSNKSLQPVFIPVLSEDQVLRLLPTLSDLAKSTKWRVRQSAVEIVPALLGCTHRLETRSEIAQLCVKLMHDSVDAVRRTAAECLCLGGGTLGGHKSNSGGEWISAIVLPHVQNCRNSPDCKQRLLSLKMVEILVANGVCTHNKKLLGTVIGTYDDEGHELSTSPFQNLLEIAASLSKDKVANVRLNVGRVFETVLKSIENENDFAYIEQVLQEQISYEKSRQGGSDRDVVFYASKALSLVEHTRNQHLFDSVTINPSMDSL